MLCSTAMSVMANEMASAELKEFEELKLIKIDSIFDSTPYGFFIAVGATEEGKKATFFYIEQSSLSDEEKRSLKKSMEELWKKYRVKAEIGEKVVFITAEKELNLAREDEATLEKLAKAVGEFWEKELVGIPKWQANVHSDLIGISCVKEGVPQTYCSISISSAPEPDMWLQIPPPSGYPEWLWNFVLQVVWSWEHYFNPSYCVGLICFELGDAPGNVNKFINYAKQNYSSREYTNAYRNLGYASHFITDVGNPLHTGAEIRQAFNKWVHYAYEGYVENNWNSGYKFKETIASNQGYYLFDNPEKATKNLANYAHQYIDTLYSLIYENPNAWQTNSTVRAITLNCLLETAKYTRGLVKYMLH